MIKNQKLLIGFEPPNAMSTRGHYDVSIAPVNKP